jgi:hypothetical protein
MNARTSASVTTPKTCMDECMGQHMLACMNGKGMRLSLIHVCLACLCFPNTCVSRASALICASSYYYCMCVACYYYMCVAWHCLCSCPCLVLMLLYVCPHTTTICVAC